MGCDRAEFPCDHHGETVARRTENATLGGSVARSLLIHLLGILLFSALGSVLSKRVGLGAAIGAFTGAGVAALVILVVIIVILRPPSQDASCSIDIGEKHAFGGFVVSDPYDGPGEYVRAQLHVHTENSPNGKWSLEEAIAHYRRLGYSFLAVTDHGRVTVREATNYDGLLVIPGEENTIEYPFWPLGQHIMRLFVSSHVSCGRAQERIDSCALEGGIVCIPHPSWPGNLGTGRWTEGHLRAIDGYKLIEVRNLHSDEGLDESIWHAVLVDRMPENPVWAVAVDDARCAEESGMGWIEVKVTDISSEALKEALVAGRFYATTGPRCRFGVRGGSIYARVDRPCLIRFVNRDAVIVHEIDRATEATYTPCFDDGFVRVVVKDTDGKRGWSQPFAILPCPSVKQTQ